MQRLVRNPFVVLAVFWGGLWLLLKANLAFAFNGIFLSVFLALSVVAVFRMVRRRSFEPYNQETLMSDRWRRWVLDEPDTRKQTP